MLVHAETCKSSPTSETIWIFFYNKVVARACDFMPGSRNMHECTEEVKRVLHNT